MNTELIVAIVGTALVVLVIASVIAQCYRKYILAAILMFPPVLVGAISIIFVLIKAWINALN